MIVYLILRKSSGVEPPRTPCNVILMNSSHVFRGNSYIDALRPMIQHGTRKMVPIILSGLYCYITLFLRITRPAIAVPNNHTAPGTGTDDGVVLTVNI